MIAPLIRFAAVLRKEFIQFRRDRVTFGIILGIPTVLMLLFGYAVNLDPRQLPTAVVDLSRDAHSRALTARLELSDYFRLTEVAADPVAVEHGMRAGDFVFVVVIPADFGRRLARGEEAPLLVEADMSDPIAASGALTALERLVAPEASAAEGGIALVVHRRFNPAVNHHYVTVTGLLGLLLEITMMISAGHALARERERGTMENLLASPIAPAELMAGKVAPYVLMGLLQLALMCGLALWLFQVPFAGAPGLLALAGLAFVCSTVLLGYTISTFARTQLQASQLITFYFTFSIMLSGFTFPFVGLPGWAQAMGEFLPLTHFLRITRGVMLKGAGLAELAPAFLALAGFVVLFAVLSVWRFRRTLD